MPSGATVVAASENGAKAKPALAPPIRIPAASASGVRDSPATVMPSAATRPAVTAVARAPARAANAPVRPVASR